MPWSGPDLGGEVAVEHRGAGISLFISGNPGRLAPVASPDLGYEVRLQQCSKGMVVSGVGCRGARGRVCPAWFKNNQARGKKVSAVLARHDAVRLVQDHVTQIASFRRSQLVHCPEVPLSPMRRAQSRTHRVFRLPGSLSVRTQ